MPHDHIERILTRLSPGRFDAARAANFDLERANGYLQSSFPVERILEFDQESRTAEFVFATDDPIEHWFGMVILDTDPSNVNLERVSNGICPFLVNHDIDQHAGVVLKDSIELGSQIRGKVKFSRSQLGEDMLNDVGDDVRPGVSIGFLIQDMILESEEEGKMPVYRAKKWELLEVSLASIPADIGAHRSFEKDPPRANSNDSTEIIMTPEEKAAAEAAANAQRTAAAPAVVERSADEIATEEITRWGDNLGCPDLAKRFLVEQFAEEKDITVTAFKRFVKDNQAATAKVPAPAAANYQPAKVEERATVQSIGDAFIKSALYQATVGKSRQRGMNIAVDVPLLPSALKRATFDSSSTGLQGYINYQAGPILLEQQRLTIRDLLAVGQTNMPSVPYIQETSYTNAATTVLEEGEKPEATFALQDEFAAVKKIAVIAKVTDEMWNDFPTLRDYINNRLRFMVQEREEAQLLSGAGTGSEIKGILTESIQSQALASDTHADAFYHAKTKIRKNGKFEPDGMVVNPDDWEQMKLAKDDNNQYYGGGPFSGGYGNGPYADAERYWGLPVVVTTAITAGTGLVGAFKLGAQIWDREGITVDATNSDEDDFRYNRMAIRVEERLALAIYRPLAFCKVTGI